MPSPKKLSESPRHHHGDNSMARKLNQGSSSYNYSSLDKADEGSHSTYPDASHRGHKDQLESTRHPSPNNRHDPRLQSRYSSHSPENRNQRNSNDNRSADHDKNHVEEEGRINGSDRNWADVVDDGRQSSYDKQNDRETMSATPNASQLDSQANKNSPHKLDNGRYGDEGNYNGEEKNDDDVIDR